MNIKEKLARLNPGIQPKPGRPSQTPSSDLSRFLPGSACATARGNCWLNRVTFAAGCRHGRALIGDLLKNDPSYLRHTTRHPGAENSVFQRLLFIDTETTGLSGGTGTLAFLVGLGFFDGRRFVVEQYMIRSFAEELPLLSRLGELLQRAKAPGGAVVSFNGKSFDMPLLANRAVFHRLHDFPADLPHIDLLYPARRLWKSVLPGCSLGTLEAEILQVRRTGDIASWLIPRTFFRYLRTADPRPLLPVLYHNQMDILSMVVLLNLLLDIVSRRQPDPPVPLDSMAVGRMLEDAHDLPACLEFYRTLLRSGMPGAAQKQVLLRMAQLHKKHRNHRAAIPLWQQALDCPGFSVEPYVELAKAYEHHIGDLMRAKEYTCRALENIRGLEQLQPHPDYRHHEKNLAWRLRRLERKLAKRL